MSGTLYLIPTTLGSMEASQVLPAGIATVASGLRYFIVEDLRSARRYLRVLDKNMDIDGSRFMVLGKHTAQESLPGFLEPLKQGNDTGLISEAGCPGIADPGAEIVKLAHAEGIKVIPLVGPSSIILAMMASGMNGQNFAFNGYLPINRAERQKRLRTLENISRTGSSAQIFMETPFRNNHLLEDIIVTCMPATMLCIACNLTLPGSFVITRTIREWKKQKPDLDKKPVIFILQT